MSFVIHPGIADDQVEYLQGAQRFLSSHGTVLAKKSPAYVVFLSATLWSGPRVIYALQSLLTLGTALFTQRRLGLWQGLALASCPFFVVWEWALLTETLCFTAMWCGWLLTFWSKRPGDMWIGAALLGIAALTRPTFLLLPFAAAVLMFVRSQWPRAALLVATASVSILLYCCAASGPSYFGWNLWIGTWERNPNWMIGGIKGWPPEAHLTDEERSTLPLVVHEKDDAAFLHAAIVRYKAKPLQALSSWFVRYRFLWIGTRTAFTPRLSWPEWFAYKAFMWCLNLCIVLAGLAGGLLALRRGDREATLIIPIIYVAAVYGPFHDTEPRYSLVAIPFLLALAVYGAEVLLRSASGISSR